jgi:hypothetical protein
LDKHFTNDEVPDGDDAKKIIDTTHKFVEGRLKVLEDEMNEEPEGYVLINIGKSEIRYYYSEKLAVKMLDSISEKDFNYIMTKIFLELNQQ